MRSPGRMLTRDRSAAGRSLAGDRDTTTKVAEPDRFAKYSDGFPEPKMLVRGLARVPSFAAVP